MFSISARRDDDSAQCGPLLGGVEKPNFTTVDLGRILVLAGFQETEGPNNLMTSRPQSSKGLTVREDLNKFWERANADSEEEKSRWTPQTSHQWYLALPHQVLKSADGWADIPLEQRASYWHNTPITFEEFEERYIVSSQLFPSEDHPVLGNWYGQLFPFGETFVTAEHA